MTENTTNTKSTETETQEASPGWVAFARFVRAALIVVFLGLAIGIATHWLKNKPHASRHKPEKQATLVEVQPIELGTETVVVDALGTVVPARSTNLSARVSGQIVEVSDDFTPGGLFEKGESILRIEPADYELALARARSTLDEARGNLQVEMGQQAVSRKEYELLGQDVTNEDRDLLLRKPQLAIARAAVASAESTVKQAELNLQRTAINAPFNAMIQERNANLGAQLGVASTVASLVGTDAFWIEVSVPVDRLKWLEIPGFNADKGSLVRIFCDAAWGESATRQGIVKRLMSELEPQGRMARILVEVVDPLDRSKPASERRPLILDSFVRVEIAGRPLENVARIPRTALHEGNQTWVMGNEQELDIRRVDIAWSTTDTVYIQDGLKHGDRLVTSALSAPARGMPLRVQSPEPTDAPQAKEAQTSPDKPNGGKEKRS